MARRDTRNSTKYWCSKNAACRHIARGHSLAESALAAGFCDQSALTKHFKRCYGMTPLQFAKAVRAS